MRYMAMFLAIKTGLKALIDLWQIKTMKGVSIVTVAIVYSALQKQNCLKAQSLLKSKNRNTFRGK